MSAMQPLDPYRLLYNVGPICLSIRL